MKPRILYRSLDNTIASHGLPFMTKSLFFFRCLFKQDLFLFNLIENPKVEDNIIFRWMLFASTEDKEKFYPSYKKCGKYLKEKFPHKICKIMHVWEDSVDVGYLVNSDEYRFDNSEDMKEIRKIVREMIILPLLDIEFTSDIGFGV